MKEVSLRGFKAWALRNRKKSFTLGLVGRDKSCPIATYISEKTGEVCRWGYNDGNIGSTPIKSTFDSRSFVKIFDYKYKSGTNFTGQDILNVLKEVSL